MVHSGPHACMRAFEAHHFERHRMIPDPLLRVLGQEGMERLPRTRRLVLFPLQSSCLMTP